MTNVEAVQAESEGTNVRKFLAQRGAIVVKETRTMGKASCAYGETILVSTMIIVVGVGEARNVTYGAKLERSDTKGNPSSSVLLDFDELKEVLEAFDFIASVAADMRQQQRDYTEVTYSTKDNARFGFYQNTGTQQAFIALTFHDGSAFLPVNDLANIKNLLGQSRTHLASKGAVSV